MTVDEKIYKARAKNNRRKYYRAAGLTGLAGFVAIVCTFMFGMSKKINDNPKSVKNLAPHRLALKAFMNWFGKKK
jgi:hypothetical protein